MFALVLILSFNGSGSESFFNKYSSCTNQDGEKAEKPTTPSDKATSGPARQTPPAATTAPAASKEMGRDHVCSAACKDGKHVYAHGEKGHKCTSACRTKGAKAEAAPAPKKMPAESQRS